LATNRGKRTGAREYVRRVQTSHRDAVTLRLNCLATRVILDDDNAATGVEYVEGESLYEAAIQPQSIPPRRRIARATREVILAGGAFNSPQLLMLSGIGPSDELRRLGIPVRVDLPGVGRNLQDRYEVGVIYRLNTDLVLLKGLTFQAPGEGESGDAAWDDWLKGRGIYTTNGAVLALVKRSTPDKDNPDLFIFGLPGYFKGYFPGYSKQLERSKNLFTWAVLKAHTENRGGYVTLRSKDPWVRPEIVFSYFDEGTDKGAKDLEAVVAGVKFVRQMVASAGLAVKEEVTPGPTVRTDAQIAEFVRNEAWGHHASCTCPIGADHDRMAVLDSRFRVRQTSRLRVVDASVFPRIPGFFIVSAVYMISEKAADVILEDARKRSPEVAAAS